MICYIRIKGHLDPSWREWLEGLEIVQEPEGTTLFSGPLADQAALHGILAKMRGLGLDLLSLETSEAFPLRNLVKHTERHVRKRRLIRYHEVGTLDSTRNIENGSVYLRP